MAKLTDILDDLIARVDKDPEYPARAVLQRGLWVVVASEKSAYQLVLSRKGEGPSEQEMQTVLKFWPYTLPEKPAVHDGVYGDGWPALECRIPRRLF